MSTSNLKKYDFSTCTKQELDVLHATIGRLRYKHRQDEERNNFLALQAKCFLVKKTLDFTEQNQDVKAVLEFGNVYNYKRKECMAINGVIITKRHDTVTKSDLGIDKLTVHGIITFDNYIVNTTVRNMIYACINSVAKGKNIIPHRRYLQLLRKYDNEVGVEV